MREVGVYKAKGKFIVKLKNIYLGAFDDFDSAVILRNLTYDEWYGIGKWNNIVYHGLSKNHTYVAWVGMRSRCYNKNNKKYKKYGGRGITVCDHWRKDFLNFYKDMGERPSKSHSIDRINNNGRIS